jgi:hypothetical protein
MEMRFPLAEVATAPQAGVQGLPEQKPTLIA